MKELERILAQPGAAEKGKVMWREMAPKILEQAHLERQKPHVDTSLKQVADIVEGEGNITIQLRLRTKPYTPGPIPHCCIFERWRA